MNLRFGMISAVVLTLASVAQGQVLSCKVTQVTGKFISSIQPKVGDVLQVDLSKQSFVGLTFTRKFNPDGMNEKVIHPVVGEGVEFQQDRDLKGFWNWKSFQGDVRRALHVYPRSGWCIVKEANRFQSPDYAEHAFLKLNCQQN